MKKLRILLADDHQVVRDGLRLLIDGQGDMRVIGEAGNGEEALRQARDLKPDVVVMDLSMPKMNGLQATERLRAESPGIKVVALTVHEDVSYLLQLCKAGAAGYVLKRSAGDDLIHAIRTVAAGGVHFDSTLASKALTGQRGEAPGKGLQQQGNRRRSGLERQDRRNLPGAHKREAPPPQPHRDRAIRLAARVDERGVPSRPTCPVTGATDVSGDSPTPDFCSS
jgi:DNA-binding NarL/FixJ family response regulator